MQYLAWMKCVLPYVVIWWTNRKVWWFIDSLISERSTRRPNSLIIVQVYWNVTGSLVCEPVSLWIVTWGLSNIQALVQMMAWHRPGGKPNMNQCYLVYWRIYASLSLNEFLMLHSLSYVGLIIIKKTRKRCDLIICWALLLVWSLSKRTSRHNFAVENRAEIILIGKYKRWGIMLFFFALAEWFPAFYLYC